MRFSGRFAILVAILWPDIALAGKSGFGVSLNIPRLLVLSVAYDPSEWMGWDASFSGAPDGFLTLGIAGRAALASSRNPPLLRLGLTHYVSASIVTGATDTSWGFETGLGAEFRDGDRTWRAVGGLNRPFAVVSADSTAVDSLLRMPWQAEIGVVFR